jgi:DNA-binding PadR family transcriptional regulator
VNDEDVDEQLLGLIWRTEPMTFGQWCNALRDAGMYPANKPEWASLFRRLDVLENEGLVEVERTSDDSLSQMQLTDAGADRVRASLDRNRGLFRALE